MKTSLRVHGAIDLGFAGLYAYLGFVAAPGRSLPFQIALAAVCALLALAGVALLVGARVARPIAVAAQVVLLGGCLTLGAVLVAGAAYLRGIYGPLGEGAAWVSVVVAALLVELCGILPIVQLRFLFRADVKRHFSVAP